MGECLSQKNQEAQDEVQCQAARVELDEMIKAIKKQEVELQASKETKHQALIKRKHVELKWTQSELQVLKLKKQLNVLMEESRENVDTHQRVLAEVEAKT